jgi:tetraacyldisaccharide 4'-kinase
MFMIFRQLVYQSGILPINQVDVPVIVVGNINIGGTGKTPLVIWLANHLKQNGYNPGIVSRGYGGQAKRWPQQVRNDSDPVMVGDEPVMIARRTNCPVAASPDRYAAVTGLVQHKQCDIIISDDGLQHYALARDIEIVVVDGVRRFGNQRCLPAGPLRESLSRLGSVDMIVCNGLPGKGEYKMDFIVKPLRLLVDSDQKREITTFKTEKVHAIAGTGHPVRFFSLLKKQGLSIIEHVFPDHHLFKSSDIQFDDDLAVVMTEKDAVKCVKFAGKNHWYLPIDVEMSNTFVHRLSILLKELKNGQEAA